jgi:arginine decarboxylase
VDTLVLRGISLPILIRFGDILRHRLSEIYQAFESAIAEHGYQGQYCCVYPIKVNQQRQVIEELFQYGRRFRFGLEAGSKAGAAGGAGSGRQPDSDHLQRLQG